MSNEKFKKRFSFRLTDQDKDIHDFVVSSKKSESETIRELLRFALDQIEVEKKRQAKQTLHNEIMNELKDIKAYQYQKLNEIVDKLDKGTYVNGANEETLDQEQANVSKSVDNSIDLMLNSFGFHD